MGLRAIAIIFPFCEFSRLCEGDNFRLAVAAMDGWRSSGVENARIVSANWAPRLPRWSATFGRLQSGFAQYRDFSPFCDFSKRCRGENFPSGRDVDPHFRAPALGHGGNSARSPALSSLRRVRVAASAGARRPRAGLAASI